MFKFHMKVVGEHIRGAYDYIEKTESIDVFGKPTDALLEMLRQAARNAPADHSNARGWFHAHERDLTRELGPTRQQLSP